MAAEAAENKMRAGATTIEVEVAAMRVEVGGGSHSGVEAAAVVAGGGNTR